MYSNVHGPDHLERLIPSVYSLLDSHSEGSRRDNRHTILSFLFDFNFVAILLSYAVKLC